MLEELKKQVLEANQDLIRKGLVTLTWGNVSGMDRKSGLVAIKPSGIDYLDLSPPDIVLVNLDGRIVEGDLNPSSDTPTHLELYGSFSGISAVAHTHSVYATMFAQAGRSIPCLGTTHSDHFFGDVPVTRWLTEEEVSTGYEINTGKVIVERFAKMNPLEMPAVLVPGHGAFVWGRSPREALLNCVALESVAQMAWGTLCLEPGVNRFPRYLLEKHYLRKHGPKAYYGQGKGDENG